MSQKTNKNKKDYWKLKKYQQGDVLFIKRDDVFVEKRKGKKQVIKENDNRKIYGNEEINKLDDDNNVVIALGEATGHRHVFLNENNNNLNINTFGHSWNDSTLGNVPRYVEIANDSKDTNVKAKLTHEEHNPIELPSGIYKVKIVREWDHIGGVSRNVVD
tara:strand:+ start:279 stop:758 length:480 start_codon:yes stop_codon:yes gene_type:complete